PSQVSSNAVGMWPGPAAHRAAGPFWFWSAVSTQRTWLRLAVRQHLEQPGRLRRQLEPSLIVIDADRDVAGGSADLAQLWPLRAQEGDVDAGREIVEVLQHDCRTAIQRDGDAGRRLDPETDRKQNEVAQVIYGGLRESKNALRPLLGVQNEHAIGI